MSKGKRPLTDEEFRMVRDGCLYFLGFPASVRDRTVFTIQGCTGLRVYEVLQLKCADVFTDRNVVRESLDAKRQYRKGKTEGRVIPLAPMAREALGEYQRVMSKVINFTPQGFLWVCLEKTAGECIFHNRPPHDAVVRRHLKAVCKHSDDEYSNVSTHSMRKMFAMRVYARLNHDLVATQRALGHYNIKSTLHYLRSCDKTIDDAIMSLYDELVV